MLAVQRMHRWTFREPSQLQAPLLNGRLSYIEVCSSANMAGEHRASLAVSTHRGSPVSPGTHTPDKNNRTTGGAHLRQAPGPVSTACPGTLAVPVTQLFVQEVDEDRCSRPAGLRDGQPDSNTRKALKHILCHPLSLLT